MWKKLEKGQTRFSQRSSISLHDGRGGGNLSTKEGVAIKEQLGRRLGDERIRYISERRNVRRLPWNEFAADVPVGGPSRQV